MGRASFPNVVRGRPKGKPFADCIEALERSESPTQQGHASHESRHKVRIQQAYIDAQTQRGRWKATLTYPDASETRRRAPGNSRSKVYSEEEARCSQAGSIKVAAV